MPGSSQRGVAFTMEVLLAQLPSVFFHRSDTVEERRSNDEPGIIGEEVGALPIEHLITESAAA